MAKKETERRQDWNAISGIMKVYGTKVGKGKNAWTKFSTSIGKKDEDGEYINLYFTVIFSKDLKDLKDDLTEGENWVSVESAFMTLEAYHDANNKLVIKPAIMITDAVLE